jgi:hypothetical protein
VHNCAFAIICFVNKYSHDYFCGFSRLIIHRFSA